MEAEKTDKPGHSPSLIELTPELSKFVENMGLHYENYGVPRIGGRILGLLLLNHRPVAPEEMSEALQVSRSSISTNIRILLMDGLVEKEAVPGDRCDYYIFSPDAMERSMEIRLANVLPLRQLAEHGLEHLPEEHPSRERLEEMVEWVDLMESLYHRLQDEWQSLRKQPASV